MPRGTSEKPKRYCSNKCRQKAYRQRHRVQTNPVTAFVTGTNADLIKQVARLYAPEPGTTVADVTFGKGVFWKKTPHLDVTGSDLVTVPERPYDFRALPYKARSFAVVVLDPPYLHSPGQHVTDHRYNNAATTSGQTYDDIMDLYRDGMTEAARVSQSLVWVKCKDQVCGRAQRWQHVEVLRIAEEIGLKACDLFYLSPTSTTPTRRWNSQSHARKTLSHLWVFRV